MFPGTSALYSTFSNTNIGPLFFLIYINDLPGMINQISLPTLFADDTNIICVHHNQNLFNKKNRGNTIENKQMVSSKFVNIKS
jgi:hypothetical protein